LPVRSYTIKTPRPESGPLLPSPTAPPVPMN